MEVPSEDVGDGSDNMHTDIDEDVIAKIRENLVSQSGGLISEPVAAALGKIDSECQVGMACPSQNAFLISFSFSFADIIEAPWYTSGQIVAYNMTAYFHYIPGKLIL